MRVFDDTKPLLDWIEKVTNEGKLGSWNVIVGGKKNDTSGTWILPNWRKINKINRSRKVVQSEVGSDIIDIGVLRDPMDLLADVDVNSLEDVATQKNIVTSINNAISKGTAGLRDKAGLGTTPQLIIYRIDKNSIAKRSSTRCNLDASEDLIGISIYIPGGKIGTSYASTISIKMNTEVFDGDADLEGTNEDWNSWARPYDSKRKFVA